ncbi:NfeD family protein [Microcoleus sp. CAWBG58]|uniref:NfeD family protein n=1 Tax=Microcoleus sp. CAWBG58 TaxID=2841651 RepID=UPI0026012E7D|nr:NfeD family protein [Microcoleus sp. CAWBG58]
MTVSDLERAIVEEEIRPDQCGRVRFQSSWWPAKCDDLQITLKPGAVVRVLRLDNITLVVEA